jgi:zinc protease
LIQTPRGARIATRFVATLIVAALAGCASLDSLNPFGGAEGTAAPAASAPRPAASAPASKPAPQGTWAQSVSDVAPDPNVRFGVLPNGMRYAILRNATPPGQASLRLRIASGSLMERDDQAGVSHFLEHMAFNGSVNVPEGDMIKILQRRGLAFGPDTNAFTSFDQTVYMLDLPETDPATVDDGLMLLRETAGNLLLDPAAIDRERGVILSEERLRDTPSLRIARRQYDFFLKDQLAPRRFPIGDVAVIRGAPRERFVEIYETYYRPERATLVAVGDFDPDQMEAKIRARFGDWKAKRPDGSEPDRGQVRPRGSEVELVVEPGGPSAVHIAWVTPPDLRPDSLALRRERLIRQLGFSVLNRRLERISRGDNPPFLGAAAYHYTNLDSADLTQVSVTAQPGRIPEGLAAAEQEARRAAQFGVQQAELDREITEFRTGLESAVQGAATRRTPSLASSIADSVNDREVFTSPAQDLALFEETVKGLKAETVSAVLKDQFVGGGPLVFVTSPTPVEGGEQAIAAALARSQQAAVSPPAAIADKTWPYVDFGAPGKVAEERHILDLDTTFVRFENGVRLTVKPTKFRADQILVSVRVGEGYRQLPRDRVSPAWMASSAFSEGGLGQLTAEEMEQVLASKVYGARLSVGEEAFSLSGGTRRQDFELQMQVLAAYLTDAAWRPQPFQRMKAYGETLLDQLASTPGGVFGRDGDRLLHSGDPRWAFPNRAEMAAARLEDLKAVIQGPLSSGPIEVVIVGDIDVETAIRETAATFGALPARSPVPAPAAARAVAFPGPTATPVRLTHRGRPDQAIAFVAWPTADFPSNPQQAREIRMLERVMELRLTDELREKEAVTYSPSTDLEASWIFPGYGYVAASVEAPPEKLQGFFDTVDGIAAQLRDKPVTADELERAKKPRIETLTKAQATNEYWLGQLGGAQEDPRRLDAVRASIPGLERVTPADVQRAARTFLRPERAWRVVVTPEGK